MTAQVIDNLPEREYHALPGLSHSSMKDLAVSPLRFWHRQINPEREQEEPTAFMQFGSALHSAALDSPEVFESKYCKAFDPSEYPLCLDKSDEIKDWIKANNVIPKGTRKEGPGGWIEQASALPNCPPILVVEERRHFAMNEGKVILSVDDWNRLIGCVNALFNEPEFMRLRSGGKSEVSYKVTDPDTGVLLRARMDYVAPKHTMDVKTFSVKGKTIDRTVVDAFHYEGYGRQAYLYTKIRHLSGDPIVPFVFVFVESEPPHEIRIKTVTRNHGSGDNLYWSMARNETERLIRLYAECAAKYGTKPWRDNASAEILRDEDIPALSW